MEISEYQAQIRNYIDYHVELGPFSVILDLVNNVGILSEKLHSVLEEKRGTFSDLDKNKVAISIGDILFDLTNMCSDLGINMDEVISLNLRKQSMIKERKILEQDIQATKPNNTK